MASPEDDDAQRPGEVERYEPLPGFAQLPRWLWRRTSRALRVTIAVVLVVGGAGAIVAAGQMRGSAREDDAAERRARTEALAERVRRLQGEVRPIIRRSDAAAPAAAPAAEQVRGRRAVLADLRASVLADARRRVRTGELDGRVRRIDCERFPRTVGGPAPEQDLGRPAARLACVAVTAEFGRGSASRGGVIGHPYRARVDFGTGRYAYCKAIGVTGPERQPLVTIPVACGG